MKRIYLIIAKIIINMIPNYRKEGKKAFWKFIIQTLINILTAILTVLGATSCMGLH